MKEYKRQGFLKDCLLFQSPHNYDRNMGIIFWGYILSTVGQMIFLCYI
jgi:hypothetical protein